VIVAAWGSWRYSDEQTYSQAFASRFQEAEFKELAEVTDFDPHSISREKLAEAKAMANFIWEDEPCRTLLLEFAQEYISTQHPLEIVEGVSGVAMYVTIGLLVTAVTLGRSAALVASRNLRHLNELNRLGLWLSTLSKRLKHQRGRKALKSTTETRVEFKLLVPESFSKRVGDSVTMWGGANTPDNTLITGAAFRHKTK
jgi:hypothetical protein